MQKINFQNLPSTTTPVNATNLNALQTNVENAIPTKTSDLTNDSDFVSYEAGTWTPALVNATATYDKQIGKYLKTGKLIHVEWQIKGTINSVSSPAQAYISGLPYSSSIDTAGSLFEYGGCFNSDSTHRLARITGNQIGIQNGTSAGLSISSWETGHGTFYLSGSATYIQNES